jgi:hypothetical protein
VSFDVGPAPASHAPSVKSLGITSQLTGSRADLIVLDDIEVVNNSATQGMRDKLSEAVKETDAIIEVVNNSATQGMRDKLSEAVKETDAIIKPLDTSKIVFLGTPQTEESIYQKLQERGYKAFIMPSEYPCPSTVNNIYGDALAPFISDNTTEDNIGKTTEPLRFTDMDLDERKLSYGRSGYSLQFLLNPRLSDQDRFPLKINDLVLYDVDVVTGTNVLVRLLVRMYRTVVVLCQ